MCVVNEDIVYKSLKRKKKQIFDICSFYVSNYDSYYVVIIGKDATSERER